MLESGGRPTAPDRSSPVLYEIGHKEVHQVRRLKPFGGEKRRVHRHIAVIGAGPFGLSLAAKLQAANADYVLFGRVMSFWREHVPQGTYLLSNPASCSLSQDGFDITAYERSRAIQVPSRLSAEEFVAYGLWFQRNAGLNADERTVVNVTRANGKFTIRVDDNDEITAEHLVVAVGLKVFAFQPQAFAALPRGFVSHTSDLHNLSDFQGKKLAIIGSGLSALECAALLSEVNADVEVVTRSEHLLWRRTGHPRRSLVDTSWSLRAGIRGALNDPDVYRRLPNFVRTFWVKPTPRQAVFSELRPRLGPVRFTFGRKITATHMRGNRVELELDDHTIRSVDHVVLGTGYRVDVNAIPFLTPELRCQIRQHDGYPDLNSAMESTVPRLYFTGAAAAWNFGRNMWFVYGAPWAADRISRVLGCRPNLSFAKHKGFESTSAASGQEGFPGELQVK
jgi:cation diffusion facilitator CzcD-associated flavoprotein CzcO